VEKFLAPYHLWAKKPRGEELRFIDSSVSCPNIRLGNGKGVGQCSAVLAEEMEGRVQHVQFIWIYVSRHTYVRYLDMDVDLEAEVAWCRGTAVSLVSSLRSPTPILDHMRRDGNVAKRG